MTSNTETPKPKLEETINLPPDEIRELVQKVEDSGVLGRSKVYADLLRYLCEAAIANVKPKEIVIAIDVMNKGADFDVKSSSMVRVYVHKLRQKLDNYYTAQGEVDDYRLVIPKGQYLLEVVALAPAPKATEASPKQESKPTSINPYVVGAFAGAAVCLLVVFGLYLLTAQKAPAVDSSQPLSRVEAVRQTPFWAPILETNDPVLIVLGDYFMFGELDHEARRDRLIREYDINSPKDLSRRIENAAQAGQPVNFYDVGLTYMPRATAFALKDILPIISTNDRTIDIRMASKFSGRDLKGQHIIYIGYISGMAEIEELAFEASSFAVGDSFDELIHIESGERHISDELHSSSDGDLFYDYGMLSTFPTLDGTQMMFIAGTRDVGLMHMAQIVSTLPYLESIHESLPKESASDPLALEVFYRVFGYDGLNFDAERIHLGKLDYQRIWGGDMMKVLTKPKQSLPAN